MTMTTLQEKVQCVSWFTESQILKHEEITQLNMENKL